MCFNIFGDQPIAVLEQVPEEEESQFSKRFQWPKYSIKFPIVSKKKYNLLYKRRAYRNVHRPDIHQRKCERERETEMK